MRNALRRIGRDDVVRRIGSDEESVDADASSMSYISAPLSETSAVLPATALYIGKQTLPEEVETCFLYYLEMGSKGTVLIHWYFSLTVKGF